MFSSTFQLLVIFFPVLDWWWWWILQTDFHVRVFRIFTNVALVAKSCSGIFFGTKNSFSSSCLPRKIICKYLFLLSGRRHYIIYEFSNNQIGILIFSSGSVQDLSNFTWWISCFLRVRYVVFAVSDQCDAIRKLGFAISLFVPVTDIWSKRNSFIRASKCVNGDAFSGVTL